MYMKVCRNVGYSFCIHFLCVSFISTNLYASVQIWGVKCDYSME